MNESLTTERSTEDLGAASSRYFLEPASRRDPSALFDRLRREEPVHRSPAGPWIVSSFELGSSVLRDSRFSREAATAQTVNSLFDPGVARDVYSSKAVNIDGEPHRRLRMLLARHFTPAAVARWRPAIEDTVNSLLRGIVDDQRMEFVHQFAYPLPERIICTMLGVPLTDHDRFEEWTTAIVNQPVTGRPTEAVRTASTAAMEEFVAYLRRLVEVRRRDLRSDLVSELIVAEEQGDRLSEIELITVLIELIMGGHDTTAHLMTMGMLTLLQRPEQWDALLADPTLITNAVEEVMRFASPVPFARTRIAIEDVQVGGMLIPAGETVVVALAAVNLDPSAFSCPSAFDVTREDNRHIGFGLGPHYCIGANLARAEFELTLGAMARRMPALRLAVNPDDLEWRLGPLLVSPAELPLSW